MINTSSATSSPAQSRTEFRAKYLVETPMSLERVAETIAGEQSSGTFARLSGETDELRAIARARVCSIAQLPSGGEHSLSSGLLSRQKAGEEVSRGLVEIAFPADNVGANLPTLLATIAGNLYELGEVTGLRLVDLDLPAKFASQFRSPNYGVEGTRDLAGVRGRPLIGTIIKPSVGLTPQQTADMVHQLCGAGVDFIKDDELMANARHSPVEERVAAVMPVIHKHADRLGRQVMYAFNVSGTYDHMRRAHDVVRDAGGTCIMVSLNWVGFSGVESLASFSEIPIHGHRNGWGIFSRHPSLGADFTVFQKLWRLAGVDHLHVNGLDSKFAESNESVIAAAKACLTPFAGVPAAMPVLSSGQWGGQAPETFKALNSIDLMYLAGGGIFAHPLGPAHGVRALHEAWEAAVSGIDLDVYAQDRPALKASIQRFSRDAQTSEHEK